MEKDALNPPAVMTDEQLQAGRDNGHIQCVVEAQNDGYICWDKSESRDVEPVHQAVKGERFWCWCFKTLDAGGYTHDYANMGPSNVKIDTDMALKLVYITDDPEDTVLWDTSLEKSPNLL